VVRARFVIIALALVACGQRASTQARTRPACLDVTADHNTAATSAVFEARHCQGGGVTWAALLAVLANRHGSSTPVEEPSSEWTGDVRRLNGTTTFAIDDEGDAARFCSDDATLVDAIHHDYDRLNQDAAALRRAMAEGSAAALECGD
jgi:hypothetical protein